jgi:hypothetical protein
LRLDDVLSCGIIDGETFMRCMTIALAGVQRARRRALRRIAHA